jgi:hypothetical protein
MSQYAHIDIVVPSNSTQRIQEMHLHVLHTICSLLETNLFNRTNIPKELVSEDGNVRKNGNGTYINGVHQQPVL